MIGMLQEASTRGTISLAPSHLCTLVYIGGADNSRDLEFFKILHREPRIEEFAELI